MTENKECTESIVLAGGCFWGLQAFLRRLPGVVRTEAGYANSLLPQPAYRQVCSGITNAAEAVKVDFDPKVLSLRQLLDAFFTVIDPEAVNRQGNDIGTSYRSGIYYSDPAMLPVIRQAVKTEQKKHSLPVATEVDVLRNFWPAEDYHQDYLEVNPGGYCHIPWTVIRGFQIKCREQLAREDAS